MIINITINIYFNIISIHHIYPSSYLVYIHVLQNDNGNSSATTTTQRVPAPSPNPPGTCWIQVEPRGTKESRGRPEFKSSGFPMISGDMIYMIYIYDIYDIYGIYGFQWYIIYMILYDASNLVISGELVNQMMTGILYLVISGAVQIFPTMTLGTWRHAISASGSKLPWFFSAELLWTRLVWKLSPWHGPPQRFSLPKECTRVRSFLPDPTSQIVDGCWWLIVATCSSW